MAQDITAITEIQFQTTGNTVHNHHISTNTRLTMDTIKQPILYITNQMRIHTDRTAVYMITVINHVTIKNESQKYSGNN